MRGSFNENGNHDYCIYINEEELNLLQCGNVLSCEIEHYWNSTKQKHLLTISIVKHSRFRELMSLLKKDKSRGFWRQFMDKIGLLKKELENEMYHHMVYINTSLIFTKSLDGKVFEQRYDDILKDKIFIFIPTSYKT